jgi:hypothetical protein
VAESRANRKMAAQESGSVTTNALASLDLEFLLRPPSKFVHSLKIALSKAGWLEGNVDAKR